MINKNPPSFIEIIGMKESYETFLRDPVGIRKLREINMQKYKKKWEEFLPVEVYSKKTKKIERIDYETWSMAFVPQPIIRPTFEMKHKDSPYFTIVLNNARDDRPQQKVPKGEDMLQKNVLDRHMIISDTGRFYLTPNGFPYYNYASLLISKDRRTQKEIDSGDISDWIKFSLLTGQLVFFNSWGAGCSRPERLHAQVVDPDGLCFEGESLKYPILRAPKISTRKGYSELNNYPLEARVFQGEYAPFEVAALARKFKPSEDPNENINCYNLLINGNEIYFIPGNRENEKAACTDKNLGASERAGVVYIGNAEQHLLEQAGLTGLVKGSDVFYELKYEILWKNLEAAGGSFD